MVLSAPRDCVYMVRYNDSAKALSLLTRGREKQRETPNSAILLARVNDRIGAPLSECKIGDDSIHPSPCTDSKIDPLLAQAKE